MDKQNITKQFDINGGDPDTQTILRNFFVESTPNVPEIDIIDRRVISECFTKLNSYEKNHFFDFLARRDFLNNEGNFNTIKKLYSKIDDPTFKELSFIYFAEFYERKKEGRVDISEMINYVLADPVYDQLNFESIVGYYHYWGKEHAFNEIYGNGNFWDILLKNEKIKHILEGKTNLTNYGLDAEHYWLNDKLGRRMINIVGDYHFSPIEPALYRIFKKHNFDFNTQNDNLETPLHIMLAALVKLHKKENDQLYLIQIAELLRAGARIDIKNNNGKTFCDIWLKNKELKVIKKYVRDRTEAQVWGGGRGVGDFSATTKESINYIDSVVDKYIIDDGMRSTEKTNKNKI